PSGAGEAAGSSGELTAYCVQSGPSPYISDRRLASTLLVGVASWPGNGPHADIYVVGGDGRGYVEVVRLRPADRADLWWCAGAATKATGRQRRRRWLRRAWGGLAVGTAPDGFRRPYLATRLQARSPHGPGPGVAAGSPGAVRQVD